MGSTNVQETRRSICVYSKHGNHKQELQVQCECVMLQCNAVRVQIPTRKHIRHFSATHSFAFDALYDALYYTATHCNTLWELVPPHTQAQPALWCSKLNNTSLSRGTTPALSLALFLPLSVSHLLYLSFSPFLSPSFSFSLLLCLSLAL